MRAALLATILSVSPLAAPVALAEYWSQPINVNPQSGRTPSIAMTPDGTPWIVTGTQPSYSRWTTNGWTPLTPIAPADDGLNKRSPILACAADGALWVMWEADRLYSTFYGMASSWSGTEWSKPDTLWVDSRPSASDYDLAPISSVEAWFVRPTNYPDYTIETIHLLNGERTVYTLSTSGGAERPSVVVDRDNVAWAIWEEKTDDPYGLATYLAYSRFTNGAWEEPKPATGPILLNRFGLVAGLDNSKWIVSQEQDPMFGMLLNTWGRRWDGFGWTPPQLIGDEINTADTTQGQMTLSRGSCGNPVATWIRLGLINPSRHDVMITQWNGSEWTRPIPAGRPEDSGLKEWPGGAANGTSTWVVYAQRVAPNWVSNAFATHTIDVRSLEGIAQFTASQRKPGVRLEWSIPKYLGTSSVRIHRSSGSYGPGVPRPPDGSIIVQEVAGARASKGSTTDRISDLPGTYSYWLEAFAAADPLGWLGPRSVIIAGAATSRPEPTLVVFSGGRAGELRLRVTGSATTPVWVSVYDLAGRLVRRIPLSTVDGSQARFEGRWDGRNALGVRVARGVYFARPEGGEWGLRARASKVVLTR